MKKTTIATTALAALLMGLPLASPAAAGDDEKIRTGACSGSAHWKLKVKPDDGRLDLEAEVDSNVNGQEWTWRIRHNGSLSARGTGTTVAPSGSFDVERRMANLAGTDTFRFRAVHGSQVCLGSISW
jgi:hypothetical protein